MTTKERLPPPLEALKGSVAALARVSGFLRLRAQVQLTLDRVQRPIEDITKGVPFTASTLAQIASVSPRTLQLSWHAVDGGAADAEPQLHIAMGAINPNSNTSAGATSNAKGNKRAKTDPVDALLRKAKQIEAEFGADVTTWWQRWSADEDEADEDDDEHTRLRAQLDLLGRTGIPPRPQIVVGVQQQQQPQQQQRDERRQVVQFAGDVHELILNLQQQPFYVDQVVHVRSKRGQDAQHEEGWPVWMPLALREALKTAYGIERLYLHQSEAVKLAHGGDKHVVVATATSSGKSICFNVPVLSSIVASRGAAKALYLFPTKALAQDQCRALRSLLASDVAAGDRMARWVKVCTFDGDTPAIDRDRLRDESNIFLTNPDMLHCSVLPQHARWAKVLGALRYIMLDEVHTYSGVFGTHVAMVVRRLRRLCSHYGNPHVQFICCSATIGNPVDCVVALTGVRKEDVALVGRDTSPMGTKRFVLWNPPLRVPDRPAFGRRDTILETVQLLVHLVECNVRTIVFCKVRKVTEVVANEVFQYFLRKGIQPETIVRAYRAGYTPEIRRSIEAALFSGQLKGVIATNALELGVDIGSLDAVIHVGFPGSTSSLFQQAGRAGRRAQESLSLFVANEEPLDQHFMRNPHEIFDAPSEDVRIDPTNRTILEQHLRCAAHERPIELDVDGAFFDRDDIVGAIAQSRTLKQPKSSTAWWYVAPDHKPPATHVSIRSIDEDMYAVADSQTGRVIEEIEARRAIFTIYTGAVFHHQGLSYVVTDLRIEERIALVERRDNVTYWTRQRDYTDVEVVSKTESKALGIDQVHYGSAGVRSVVFGYHKLVPRTRRIIETVELALPAAEYTSTAFWVDVPLWIYRVLAAKDIVPESALHGLSHLVCSLVPLFVRCKGSDMGTECRSKLAVRERPFRVVAFERHGYNTGLSVKAYDQATALFRRALEVLESCACQDGCPSCIVSTSCSENNEMLDKRGARLMARCLLGHLDEASAAAEPEETEEPHRGRAAAEQEEQVDRDEPPLHRETVISDSDFDEINMFF